MLFDDFFNRDIYNFNRLNFSDSNTTIPAVNIKETPGSFEVEVAAPGMSKKDFKIELEGNVLTIASENVHEAENKEERYFQKEFSYQSFHRTFNRQKDVVDIDKVTATYTDGVLRVSVPRKEEARLQQSRLIPIS